MLPGFRFLCAAVVLAVSLVIFGFGAAALLRSAHEEFASVPGRRPQPPAIATTTAAVEPPPTLAMLRLEPRIEEPPVAPTPAPPSVDQITATAAPSGEKSASADPVAVPPTTALSAAASPTELVTADTVISAKPELPSTAPPATAVPAMVAAAPAASEPTAVPVQESSVASMAPTGNGDTTASVTFPATTLTDDDVKLTSTRIATLGGPPVDIEPVPLPVAKPVIVPRKKVVEKKTPKTRKRRADVARPVTAAAAAPAQPADPFGQQPFGR